MSKMNNINEGKVGTMIKSTLRVSGHFCLSASLVYLTQDYLLKSRKIKTRSLLTVVPISSALLFTYWYDFGSS